MYYVLNTLVTLISNKQLTVFPSSILVNIIMNFSLYICFHNQLHNIYCVYLQMSLCIYKWPHDEHYVTMEGINPSDGVLRSLVCNNNVQVLVRVYVVRAYNLHPSDPDGKADPFIEISTSNKTVSDAKNYFPKQLNPVFGR